MRSSDSRVPIGRRSGYPSRTDLSRRRCLFLAVSACTCGRADVGEFHRVPVAPEITEKRHGPPRLLGRPLSRVPRSYTPPDANPPSPYFNGRVAVAFERNRLLGIRDGYSFRGRIPHGPRARAPMLRRPRYRDRRQARYRLGLLGPSPDGIRTRWTTFGIS